MSRTWSPCSSSPGPAPRRWPAASLLVAGLALLAGIVPARAMPAVAPGLPTLPDDPEIQWSFPGRAPGPEVREAELLDRGVSASHSLPPPSPPAPGKPPAGWAAPIIGWLALGLAAVLVLAMLGVLFAEAVAGRVRGRRPGPRPGSAGEDREEEVAEPPSPDRAAALAAAGRYAEAAHLLVTGVLARLVKAAGTTPPRSATARELLRLARVDDARKSALRVLVSAAEAYRFGGRPCSAADCERLAREAAALAGASGAAR